MSNSLRPLTELLDAAALMADARENSASYGPMLKRARQSVGMTLESLSNSTTYTPGMLSMVENGKRAVTPSVLNAYAAALEEGGWDASNYEGRAKDDVRKARGN